MDAKKFEARNAEADKLGEEVKRQLPQLAEARRLYAATKSEADRSISMQCNRKSWRSMLDCATSDCRRAIEVIKRSVSCRPSRGLSSRNGSGGTGIERRQVLCLDDRAVA